MKEHAEATPNPAESAGPAAMARRETNGKDEKLDRVLWHVAKVLQLTAKSIIKQVDGAAKIILSSSKDTLEHLKTARIFFERGLVRRASAERIVRIALALGPDFPFGFCPHDHTCSWPRDPTASRTFWDMLNGR